MFGKFGLRVRGGGGLAKMITSFVFLGNIELYERSLREPWRECRKAGHYLVIILPKRCIAYVAPADKYLQGTS